MPVVMLSLTVAFVVCVLLLAAVGLFTLTPLARRIQEDERRQRARLS